MVWEGTIPSRYLLKKGPRREVLEWSIRLITCRVNSQRYMNRLSWRSILFRIILELSRSPNWTMLLFSMLRFLLVAVVCWHSGRLHSLTYPPSSKCNQGKPTLITPFNLSTLTVNLNAFNICIIVVNYTEEVPHFSSPGWSIFSRCGSGMRLWNWRLVLKQMNKENLSNLLAKLWVECFEILYATLLLELWHSSKALSTRNRVTFLK